MQSDFAIVIDKRPVKNFWKGRGGFLPIAIVEKMIQGKIEDAEQFFDGRRPEGEFAVSAHYAVARDGRVWQFVDDEDTAWSNGVLQEPAQNVGWLKEVYQEKVNCNLVTLSIDYEGYSGEPLSPEQYQAALALHRQLVQRWEIEMDGQHIIGHNLIDSLERGQNPGPAFPFDQLLQDLQTAPAEPAAAEEMTFEDEPLPETVSMAPLPQAVETENVAAYQPETVEEPAYRPQVEAFNFAPGLNDEVDQVTVAPEEVNPATAEPLEAEPASPDTAAFEPFTLESFEPEAAQAETQVEPAAPEIVPSLATETPWQLPESLEFTDSAGTPVTGEEPAVAPESPETASEGPELGAPDAAWDNDFLADIPPFQFDEESSAATAAPVEETAAEPAEPAQAEEAPEVAPAISDMVTPKSNSQIFNYNIAPATPFSMPSIVDFESEAPPAPEPLSFADQIRAASQSEIEAEEKEAESTAVPEAALPAETSVQAAETATAPAPAGEVKQPAPEPEKPKEKHHWYDRIKSLFVHEDKQPEAPVEPAAPASVAPVPAETAPVSQQAVAAEPAVEAVEASVAPEPAEVEAAPASLEVEPAAEPDEASMGEAAAEAEESLHSEAAEPEPETEEAEAATAVEEPETPAAPETAEAPETIAAVEAEETPSEAAGEAESLAAIQAGEAEAIEAELASWPDTASAELAAEPETVQPEPASEAQPVEAEQVAEALVEPGPAEPAPVVEDATRPEPQEEESFYPFELDNTPTTDYGSFFRSQPASAPVDYNFRPSSPEQDLEFQDLNGPSDYPFALPETDTRPQNFTTFAEPARPPSFDVAPEPLRFEENLPAPSASQSIEPPLFRETQTGTGGLSGAETQATGPHGFAYDDLELPAWLEEPEPDLPAPPVPPAFAPEPPKRPGLDIPADPNAFAWASSPYAQDDMTPGWLQKPDESPTPEPVQPTIRPALKDTPAVPLPNKDWQEDNLFADDDFLSMLNQSGLDLEVDESQTAPGRSQTPPPPPPDFDNIFAEDEPPAKPTLRQIIDRNDGYTAPLSYEDLDMSVPLDLEEDLTPPGSRKPLVPAEDRKDAPSFGDDFFENEPFPASTAAPVAPARNDPPGFNRVELGGGRISVELANIRTTPSYDKSTILRVAEQGERFEFDGWIDGPELRSSTRWYRISPANGEGWIHSTLVALDRPFRG